MKLDDKQIAAIRDGTEGVTPGPWALSKRSRYKQSIDGGAWFEFCKIVVRMKGDPDDELAGLANASHIARCDPDTIRSLATEVLESRAEIERLMKERDEERAEIADSKLENGYVIGWNSGWDEAFQRLKFPTMLRKMWSGGDVQRWLDERREEQTGPIPGSLSERMFAAEARVAELEALLDVDRLTEIITDSIDLDWTPRDAAMALVRAMGGDGT
jgi:hypothetical protein